MCNIYLSHVAVEPAPRGAALDGRLAVRVFVGSTVVEVTCPPYEVFMVVGSTGVELCAEVFAVFLRRYGWAAPCIASALDIAPGEEAWARELLERVLALLL